MEFSSEAKQEIEKNLDEIVRNINVDNKEREEIVKELRSTYYEAAESEAKARGAGTVELVDARAARASISSPRETADSFMQSYASNLKRAGFWWRLAAFVIDNIILCILVLIVVMPTLIALLLLGMPFTDHGANQLWFNSLSVVNIATLVMVGIASAVSALIIVFGYYIFLEGHYGYTIGKYLLGLRVLKTNGTKIGYRESILRNISKYINNLIIIDTLIMLIFFYHEKQRGFDRIANTMVVHLRS